MRVNNEQVVFNIFKSMKYPIETDDCFAVNQVDQAVIEFQKRDQFSDLLEHALTSSASPGEEDEADQDLAELMAWLDNQPEERIKDKQPEPLSLDQETNYTSANNHAELELKPLPRHLKYAFLEQPHTWHVIISASLTPLQEEKLLRVLRDHRPSIGWTIADI